MNKTAIVRSERVRKRVQLGIIPILVGSVTSIGAPDLVESFGVAQVLALVGLMIFVQLYLIIARVWFDIL